MKTIVITDSNSGISQEEAKELNIKLVPMPVLIDGEEYFEDVSISQTEFYEKLKNNAQVSTSQPNLFGITELWTEILKEYDEIVYIPMSSALSASCENTTVASNDFAGKVFVVNNKRISVTQKQSVYDAIELAKQGKTAKEIKEYLENTSLDASIYIMLTTLKYLKKGGRITPAAALIGDLIGIKPILQIQGGKLDKFAQVISYNQGKKKMIEQLKKDIETRLVEYKDLGKLKVFVAYTNCLDKANQFKEEINKAFSGLNLEVSLIDALPLSIACHIGDGAIAIACARTV